MNVHIIYTFQFQHGTIKSPYVEDIRQQCLKFQFQHGTIKSIKSNMWLTHFKSFNSNMVRLKVLCNVGVLTKGLFQFQHGTIKTTQEVGVGTHK